MLAFANSQAKLSKAKLLFHEISGFVNDRGAMRQRLTQREQLDRDEFSDTLAA